MADGMSKARHCDDEQHVEHGAFHGEHWRRRGSNQRAGGALARVEASGAEARAPHTTSGGSGLTLSRYIWRKSPPSGTVADQLQGRAAAVFSSIQSCRNVYSSPVRAALEGGRKKIVTDAGEKGMQSVDDGVRRGR